MSTVDELEYELRAAKAELEIADGEIERLTRALNAIPPKPAPDALRDVAHALNEWADLGSNAIQWLKNIRDGISSADEALKEMSSNYDRVLALSRAALAPLPAGAAEADYETAARALGFQQIQAGKWFHPAQDSDLEHCFASARAIFDHYFGKRWLASPPLRGEREAMIRELCGDELNGGLIRDLCFTVWTICHNPKHEDGNSDWGSDTLPTVQKAVEIVRSKLALQSSPAALSDTSGASTGDGK